MYFMRIDCSTKKALKVVFWMVNQKVSCLNLTILLIKNHLSPLASLECVQCATDWQKHDQIMSFNYKLLQAELRIPFLTCLTQLKLEIMPVNIQLYWASLVTSLCHQFSRKLEAKPTYHAAISITKSMGESSEQSRFHFHSRQSTMWYPKKAHSNLVLSSQIQLS